MSSSEAGANEKLLQYVERALLTNPLEESAAIIRRRNRLLGLEPTPASATPAAKQAQTPAVDPAVKRQHLLKRIETIRAGFWSMDLTSLRGQIDALDAGDFPDVDAVVRRLATVAKHRDQIPRILGNKAFDPDFFKIFKEVIIASPRDSAIVKEKALVAFGERKLRNRGTKMIKLMEKELPHYYHLETQWLKSLMAQRGRVSAPVKSQDHFVESGTGGFFSGIPWWGYFVIISLIRVVINLVNSD
jgi:hypothetical protein